MIKIITTKEYTDLAAAREKLRHVEWTAGAALNQAKYYYAEQMAVVKKLENANKQLTGAYNMVNELKYENEQATKYIEDLEYRNSVLQEALDDLFYGG